MVAPVGEEPAAVQGNAAPHGVAGDGGAVPAVPARALDPLRAQAIGIGMGVCNIVFLLVVITAWQVLTFTG